MNNQQHTQPFQIIVVWKGGYQKRYRFNNHAHYEAWKAKHPLRNVIGVYDVSDK
jgi:hypothetical protein